MVKSNIGQSKLSTAADRLLNKLYLGMKSSDQYHVMSMPYQSVSQNGRHITTEHYFDVIREAIRKHQYLVIEYIDLNNETSKRKVRSIGLTFFDEVWLLTAWCELRQSFRNFRVDRIQSCLTLEEFFPNEANKSFKDYLKNPRNIRFIKHYFILNF